MENINKLEIVPDEVYEIGADKAPVIPEWSVKDDETLRKKVYDLAHSTFDRSKFTVVGSPNITDDGIASGFSSGNYIKNSNVSIPFSTTKDTIIKCRIKMPSTRPTTGNPCAVGSEGNNFLRLYISSGANTRFSFYIRGTIIGFAYDTDTYYDIIAQYHNGVISLSYKKASDTSWNEVAPATVSDTTDFSGAIVIGNRGDYIESWTGSIDLKQFSITVDGVEVFSGNKTGIDTIKPDNFTLEGSVASLISDGGIMQISTSSSDYISTSEITINDSSIVDINIEFDITKELPSGQYGMPQLLLTDSNNTTRFMQPYVDSSKSLLVNKNGAYQGLGINLASLIGHWKIKITSDAEYYYYDFYKDEVKLTIPSEYIQYAKLEKNVFTAVKLQINTSYRSNLTPTSSIGSIDLNSFKIYVDGNLVYQPCLKIPYTEGINNNKIVDSLYRDRVKDLFEQKGYNGYYTIGEDDFTLPSNKWSDVIEHKENGLTVAEQRVDQTLTIRGACESGTDVNLPMEFFDADSYAVFGVGTTGTNTASKFTPAADGNYIAIGKGKV